MAEFIRKASAQWQGSVKAGKGTVSVESGVFSTPYSFGTRFETEKGSNPEELLASSHAACFTMQLSALISGHDHEVHNLQTEATCTFSLSEKRVAKMHLVVRGKVSECDQAHFEEHVKEAASICPISKALENNVEITYEAILE